MSNATSWMLAAIILAVLSVVVVLVGEAIETQHARECDAMGRTMIDGRPYQCARFKSEVTR